MFKCGIIFESMDSLQLSEILYENFKKDKFKKLSSNIIKYKKNFSWKNFVSGIDELIAKL